MTNRKGFPDHGYETQVPNADGSYPVEPKTKAAAVGGGVGGAAALFLVWLLDGIFWNGELPPDVPAPVAGLVWVVVPGLVAWGAAWQARHVNRALAGGRITS